MSSIEFNSIEYENTCVWGYINVFWFFSFVFYGNFPDRTKVENDAALMNTRRVSYAILQEGAAWFRELDLVVEVGCAFQSSLGWVRRRSLRTPASVPSIMSSSQGSCSCLLRSGCTIGFPEAGRSRQRFSVFCLIFFQSDSYTFFCL